MYEMKQSVLCRSVLWLCSSQNTWGTDGEAVVGQCRRTIGRVRLRDPELPVIVAESSRKTHAYYS